MLPSPSLRIIIPACNEAERIAPTIHDYCSKFSTTGVVIVVANGCTDDTVAIVRDLQSRYANLELIDVAGRIGKGGAVRLGLWTGKEPYVGFVDADGSTSATEFMRLFGMLRSSQCGAIIGSRWMRGADVSPKQPFARRVASRTFNMMARLLFGIPFVDTQCGAKIFSRAAISEISASLEVAGFAFDIEVLWRLHRHGIRVLETPTVWADRNGSKIRLASSSLSMLRSLLRMRLRESWLWIVPFVDRFERGGVMPVVERHRVLILGGSISELEGDPAYRAFFEAMRVAGFQVTDVAAERHSRASKEPGRLSTLAWYALHSHRDYDALIEIPIGSPSGIPTFSLKPSFVISKGDSKIVESYRARYRRATFIDLSTVAADDALATVLLTLSGSSLYRAEFHCRHGEVAVRYSAAGTHERRVIAR